MPGQPEVASEKRSADDKLAGAQEALAAKAREIEALRDKLASYEAAAKAAAAAPRVKVPRALVNFVDNVVQTDADGKPLKQENGLPAVERKVVIAKGAPLPFDPTKPPPGFSGIKRGQHWDLD